MGQFLAISAAVCITGTFFFASSFEVARPGGHDDHGAVSLSGCKGSGEQQVEFTSSNYIQLSSHVNHHLVRSSFNEL